MKVTPFFPLFFLFGISAFAIRSLVGWLKWWGYPFLITGAISSVTALLGAPIFGLIVQSILQNQGAGYISPVLLPTVQEMVSALTTQILKPVAIEGAILGILGLGMAVVAVYLTKKKSS
jgi:hypothetical protein